MALVTTKEMILDAQRRHYAVPAINTQGGNYDIIRAICFAADKLRSPVILAHYTATGKYSGDEWFVEVSKYFEFRENDEDRHCQSRLWRSPRSFPEILNPTVANHREDRRRCWRLSPSGDEGLQTALEDRRNFPAVRRSRGEVPPGRTESLPSRMEPPPSRNPGPREIIPAFPGR
ncbi:fructose-bisphosphate aldolase class II [Hydrogenispora ethanolica]|uniref:Fructose-bisphosphate aldolase class II n=1 Tax=Hydrogenispora ethanolica TaxID=1082276 RepID=A0A4V2QGN7_HYDET|nr:fructose-bisphosphate aldolase class II [Hydrogenispora ethanolica]